MEHSSTRTSPLSQTQLGIYLDSINTSDGEVYHVPLLHKLSGYPDAQTLRLALEKIIAAHPGMSAKLTIDAEGNPCMADYSSSDPLQVETLTMSYSQIRDQLPELITPFDLEGGRLGRICIIDTEKGLYMFSDFHHVIYDGMSQNILIGNLDKAFRGEAIPPEGLSMFDVADREAEIRATDRLAEAAACYSELLEGADTSFSFPSDLPGADCGIATISYPLDMKGSDYVDFCRCAGLPQSAVAIAAMGLSLQSFYRRDDITFATIYHGRKEQSQKETFGMFVKTLPARVRTDKDTTLGSLLEDTARNLKTARDNDIYSYAEAASDYGVNSRLLFAYQGEFLNKPTVAGADVEEEILPSRSTGSDITASLWIDGQGKMHLNIEYLAGNYSERLIKALASSYAIILKEIVSAQKETRVSDLNRISAMDLETVAAMGDGGTSFANADDVIPSLFSKAAAEHPDNIAVVYRDRSLSYRMLDNLTNSIAHNLREEYGVGEGTIVGVLIDRSELMAILPLAIMKAGGAYMPLDPHFPQDRLSFMAEDAGLSLIIEDDGLAEKAMPDFPGTVIPASRLLNPEGTDDSPICDAKPESDMVILYTSGSTGKPKGVTLTQRNIANFVAAYRNLIGLSASDRSGAYAAFGFDAHMMDLYPTLASGATIHIFDPEIRLDLTAMHDYIERNGITVMFMTTQIAWQMATLFEFSTLRVFSGGGEKLPPIGPLPYDFFNLYGPTECSVIATAFHLEGATDGRTIGHPIPGYRVIIADQHLKPVAPGVAGELIIAGPGVGVGYLNRPELTAEKFIEVNGERAYRTGDLARFQANGEIEFLGRMDGMVKLRGLRIELGEIEAVASRHPAVKTFCATVKEIGGMENLAGYYVAKEGCTLSPDELREFMSSDLTEFMLPSVIMQLEKMPMTPNGKVNRRALPVPEVAVAEIVAPATEMEEKVLGIASEVLSHDGFGVTANLVSEGLTSLMAMRLVASIQKNLGLKITAKTIMSGPSVREIASSLESAKTSSATSPSARPKRRYYPLTENQRGVFIDWEMNREALQYNIPQVTHWPDGTDPERLRKAVLAVVDAHPGLKTRLTMRGADIMQERRDDDEVEITITELNFEPDAEFFQSKVRPFDLLGESLFRCDIFTFGNQVYLMRDTHHIIFDGVSAMLFSEELMKAFAGEALEKETYGALDHALDEADLLQSEETEKAEKWFAGLIGDSEPTAYPHSSVPDNDIPGGMGRLSLRMPSEGMKGFCTKGGITTSNYLLAAFLQLLHRLTREKTIQITTINNGRSDMRLLQTTGMYVKTLPVVSRVEKPVATPLEYAGEVQRQFLIAQDYDFYPFTSLVEKMGVRPEIMYVYEGGIVMDAGDAKIKTESIILSLDTAKVPLTMLVFEPSDKEYELTVEYDTSVYGKDDMSLLLSMMRTLSLSLTDAQTIADARMADDKQQKELEKIRHGDKGEVPYPNFPWAMEFRAKLTPDFPALVACDKALTYREFDSECNRIANALIRRGVCPGDRVVVLLPRRSYLISSIYGIMKTGAAYIPCDPEYPADRIRLITEDSDARLIITTPDRMELYPGKAVDVNELLAETCDCKPDVKIDPDSVAYMIYTSGSTGRPKGVMIPHRCIADYLYGYYRQFYLPHPEIKVNMLIVTISFDASLVDLGTSLTSGHTLVLANEEECKDVNLLSQLMLRYGVDAFDITPSRLEAMLDLPEFAKAVSQAKLLNIGGEGFQTSLINKLFATGFSGQAVNEYGPTECTVGSNHQLLYPDTPITAGPPFYNESERIIDAWGGELPIGAVGELYIFGNGVGLGYNKLPEKTAEAFVDYHGERGYRTGDLARWTEGGDVAILGRIDHQVKLRGLRIELGEIESVAAQFDGIRNAVADVREVNKIQHLCLYFTSDKEIDKEALRIHLATSLTEYMVPDSYIAIDEIPLTPNGKANRKALPDPEPEEQAPYVEPAEGLEKTIADTFARILNRDKVGANDDFFSIGGTSINAIKVVAALTASGNTVSYKNVFDARTPRGIAALIEGRDITAAQPIQTPAGEGAPQSEFADVLDRNTLSAFNSGESQSLGNVLLTGATGFMGIHMLHELLTTTDSRICCTLRGKGELSALSRLRTLLFYYFDNTFDREFADGRITVVEADVTEPVPEIPGGKIDTIINCAANVKHFSAGDDIEKVNVESVRNLIDFCLKEGARLVHISTVSVAGESVNGYPDPSLMLTERMLDFGQNLSNQYVHSKYNAEHLILTAIRDSGLNAKIMRVGNLSARGSDGEFQINFRSNAFMGRLKAYVAIGCVPFEALDAPCEFSPIDEVCRAILMLASTAKEMCVFQPCNNHRLPLGDVLHILGEFGYDVLPVEDGDYPERLAAAMSDAERVDALQPLLAYDSDNASSTFIRYDATYTNQILYRLGFRWNYTSHAYVSNFLKAISSLNFFAL